MTNGMNTHGYHSTFTNRSAELLNQEVMCVGCCACECDRKLYSNDPW